MNYLSKKRIGQHGFALIEVTAVVGISILLATLALAPVSKLRSRAALDGAEASVIRAIDSSRTKAMSGVGTTEHGVHIESGKVVLFAGNTYTSGDPANKTYTIPASVTLSSTEQNIVFRRLSGAPSATTTVSVVHSGGVERKVFIDERGGLR